MKRGDLIYDADFPDAIGIIVDIVPNYFFNKNGLVILWSRLSHPWYKNLRPEIENPEHFIVIQSLYND